VPSEATTADAGSPATRPPGLQSQPSWAQSAQRPVPGAWCNACHGLRWWTERQQPKGWRCLRCHPPAHLPPQRVEIVGP
jgi:hypothetical protein